MDLYTETILDHYEYPRHAGRLVVPTIRVREDNVLCGDYIELDCLFDSRGGLADIAFTGSGCAISQASMSLLSETVIGKTCQDIWSLSPDAIQQLIGSSITPARLRCAMLGVVALKRACEAYAKKKK